MVLRSLELAQGHPAVRDSEFVTQSLLNWILTIPFLLAFAATLLLFDAPQRLARIFGQRPQEIVAGWLQICLVQTFRITGMRLIVEKSPLIEEGGAYLIIANHQSLFDIPIIGATLFSNFPKYVSKRELARWLPSISYNLRRGGNAIIERGDRGQATQAIRRLGAEAQRRRVSAVIYPEGTRSRTGKLRRFRKPGTIALMESAPDLPIVPVTIDGAWNLLAHNLFPVPFRSVVRLHIGDPIPRSEDECHDALFEESRERIEKKLQEWRTA